jgi:hypothetical protein
MNDDVLIRYLDGEAAASEIQAVEALSAADPAARRLWELRAASAGFRKQVEAVEVPALPPLRRRRSFHEAKAAAITLLLLAGAAAASPTTRSMIADGVLGAVERIRGNGPASPAGPAGPGGASVGFQITGTEFTLEVVRSQSAGSVLVAWGDGAEVTAQTGTAELVVLPDRLLVRNDASDGGDIRLTVPAAVGVVRVIVAGREVVVRRADSGASSAVPLRE